MGALLDIPPPLPLSFTYRQPAGLTTPQKMKESIASLKKEFTKLFKELKKQIGSDTLVETGDGFTPGLSVTIGFYYDNETDEVNWNFQTGDTSYAGPCYSFEDWVTTTLLRKSNSAAIAQEVVDEISNTVGE